MNAADAELLTCLIEECAEIIHAGTKMLRHGPDSRNPDEFQLGPTNREHLSNEVGQLNYLTNVLTGRGLLIRKHVMEGHEYKFENWAQYLHHNRMLNRAIVSNEEFPDDGHD